MHLTISRICALILFLCVFCSGMAQAAPATPSLISPANLSNVGGTSIPFRWSASTGATNYYLQVSANAGFTSIVYGAWVGNYIGITLTGLPDNGQIYYWRVAAADATGSSSFLSSAWSVTNGPSAVPATPTLGTPVNGAKVNGTSITFSWTQAARATNYYLQVASDSAFTKITYANWVGNYLGVTLSGMPDNGQVFYWRVAAGNSLGSGYYSTYRSVINGPSALPAIPALGTPVNGAKVNGTSIAFTWTQAARANNYYLQVATDTGFTSIVYGAWVGNYLGVTLSGMPDNGQVYYWRVASRNSLGSSTYSPYRNVINGPSAVPAQPLLMLPYNGAVASGASVNFQWVAAARARNYYLQVSTNPSFSHIIYGAWVGNYVGVTLNGLPDNGQFLYWRVMARNSLGTSPYSDAWYIINGPSASPGVPALLQPANGTVAPGTSVSFSWSQAARANNYYLEVATDTGFTQVVFGQWLGNYIGVTLNGLPDNGQRFYWRVAAGNGLGSGLFSGAWSLINGPSAVPDMPIPLSPRGGVIVDGVSVTFTWTASARAADYYVQVATTLGFNSGTVVFDNWVGNTTGVVLTGFSNDGQLYYWRMAARNSKGSSFISDPPAMFKSGAAACADGWGNGTGSLTSHSHVDTCYDDRTSGWLLNDISRRYNSSFSHNHGGNMLGNASINTSLYGGGIFQDADNIWDAGGNQASGVDAHVYAGWVYDYLWSNFRLNSYDGFGISMRSNVGLTTCTNNNAYWDRVSSINYCNYAGQTPYSTALDVVGHEWAHAVTQMAGANLAYQWESGALNEAFSDWMGTAVEHVRGEFNWTIGEGAGTIRDMANPLAYGQPDTYGVSPWVNVVGCTPQGNPNLPGYNDSCGVHTNSGVANKMFYLLSVGGTHNGVVVRGIGIEKAIRIAYRANTGGTDYWQANTDFVKARTGMIKAAADLSMNDPTSFETNQVRNAWAAVKVDAIHTIDATASPAAGGTVSGAGSYSPSASVSLTATANPGYVFVNWTEYGVQVSVSATYSFTANSSRSLVANFRVQ